MEFPKPECNNCGHVNDLGQCSRNDGKCRHVYKPSFVSHVFKPVKYHRQHEAMEYERVINQTDGDESVANGKLILSSNELWEVFHTQSDRATSLAKWCEKNVIDKPENYYATNPQTLEYNEDEND
ncbi:hypothetical protein VPH1254_0042 [Vibrio phage 1254]|nr:hypothetical protein SIPHO018v1_120003 [Vibrio phage 11E33.1]QZI86732.1 hypothetical protein SIPHO019v1_120003 [Vibrio phage 82E32.1]QZI92831.1 hypothetical protein SIPHO016v1_p0052 [Vibrio phage 38E33.6a]QZI92957.1 hypothetical protein SIPHO015v1_p0019 [Vibrio phage 82E32.2]QZI93024.1 hypothetical protein SIPHO014v1_p0025 [Vibrio phage 82E32.3]QZI93071.1 hypothetical protein SIPHO013v1_p0010 [Vibrio phage 82E33.2]CAH9012347.1 hypothetical protein VP168E361_P0041 [Vibrio phage 168E36-1]